ncbi:sensor histidine kinase [uncultured Paenibacillus sp.]|uniref:sensor histidine kinase n=1 Tax=uncultured Paenibacillus sp. TaxID=227322 RepID=UPI0015ADC63B|nr:sensor histidine kinase [uncultured Paenibacillus sp.]
MKTSHLETYGLLIMLFDQTLFSSSLDELTRGEAGKVYLFDARDRLLYTDDSEAAGLKPPTLLTMEATEIRTVDQTPYLFSRSHSDATSFSLISRVSLQDIRSQTQNIFKIALYSAILSIIAAWILVMLTGQRLLRPLKMLVQGMRRLREGRFDTRLEIHSRDELGFLGQSFNSMAANIDSLIKEVYERKINEREAELKALQAQINPHFLYNTLDTIYWSVYLKDDFETAKLVVSLSQLLRYALESVHEKTTLNDEIHQIENYLYIQRIRFRDELITNISIDDEVRDCLVIRLIMQPLVENIFIHAFREKQSDLKIEIRAYRNADKLIIEIADNGCGISEENVLRLTDVGKARVLDRSGSDRIGINSVIRRIDLIYGQEYGLEIGSKLGAGTVMKLCLPFQQQEHQEAKEDVV